MCRHDGRHEGTRARHEGAKTYIRKCVAVFIHSVFDSRHSEINSKVKGPSIASGMGGEESRR